MAAPTPEAAMSEAASTLRQQLIRNTDEVKQFSASLAHSGFLCAY